jgi:hypothetical protein
MADERFQSEELTKRRPGRPRSPVTTKPLSDERAYWRLRENRMHNSFAAIRVLAFCSVWQRNGGTIDGVVMSGYCGRRTVFYRLDSCHRAAFEPELVWWGLKTGEEWGTTRRISFATWRTTWSPSWTRIDCTNQL